jgi:ATP-binding cassette subfamily B protein/subfamily B ATP-binding cassette protein MsbA
LSYAVSKAGASLERIQEVLHTEPTVTDRPGAEDLVTSGPIAVSFRDVTFGYSKEHPVLEEVTLAAEPGQLVAIVGRTGSGKSTLLSLVPRFYDPWSGQVLIDGHDARDVTLRSLRDNVAVVLQDSLIFRTTVLENIAYGRPDASRPEIVAAAEAAGVGLIAARLEDGYETIVSERGASLSGGEKQCIGVARALLKNAPVVILDEPTSSMDAHTERLVMAGIERLLGGRTAFIIAHRLSTVMKADLVAVMDAGRIMETGSPTQLLEDDDSHFARLARAQHVLAPPLPESRAPADKGPRGHIT